MGTGRWFIVLGVLWLLQSLLTYRQARGFMARVGALRSLGKVAIGASGNRLRGRAYVALAVGPDDRVVAAEALRGVTLFAHARPVPGLLDRRAAELAAGAAVPSVPDRVLAAAHSAAAALHQQGGIRELQ